MTLNIKDFCVEEKVPLLCLEKEEVLASKVQRISVYDKGLKGFKKRDMVQNVGKNWRKLKFCK